MSLLLALIFISALLLILIAESGVSAAWGLLMFLGFAVVIYLFITFVDEMRRRDE